ncbi:MAG: phosphate ABC transporter permease subunit PstC [Cellulosilyticaceae bacterium]
MEKTMKRIFWGCAMLTIGVVAFMGGYIVLQSIPFFKEVSLWEFLSGQVWSPQDGQFGIFPMIVSSILATVGAVGIAVVIGIATAIVMVEICSPKVAKGLSVGIDLLAGIPSVIYGFWGLMVIVPMIYDVFGGKGGGNSLLAAICILAVMILPTVIRMTEVSLKAIPKEYREGALALGATPLQYIFKVQLQGAKSGIVAGIVLAIGRALGETMAVILVAGNTPLIPGSITDPVRTLTANIAIEMGYASGLHQQALFATGMVLFVMIIGINVFMRVLINKKAKGR